MVFGGTTEGRMLLEAGLPCVYSAATEYGAELAGLAKRAQPAKKSAATCEILSGRLEEAQMVQLAGRGDIVGVVDATHPYATEVRGNIARACRQARKPLFRVERASTDGGDWVLRFSTCLEAAAWLDLADEDNGDGVGNLLVTVGSKEMACFTKIRDFRRRVHFRVLPTSEVVGHCEALGVDAGHIIAEQGPFSELANRAHLERSQARFLVTKDGGPQGGVTEKLAAAKSCGVRVLLIERPSADAGDFADVARGDVARAISWGCRLLGLEEECLPIVRGGSESPVPMFPMFVDLAGKTVLVAGGGRVALRKAGVLVRCGAALRVVAPQIRPEFEMLKGAGKVELIEREYGKEDLQGVQLAIVATNDRAVNAAVARDAADLAGQVKIPVNVADSPAACTFYFPSFVEYGGYAAGISSAGSSPRRCRALADRLRGVWRDWVEDVEGERDEQNDR